MMKQSDVGLLFQVLTDSSRVYITRGSGWRQCHIPVLKGALPPLLPLVYVLVNENLHSLL